MAPPQINTAILGQEVAVSSIPKSLRELWAADEAATKAALINFAIYSEGPSTLDDNTALISEVTREHACRALLIAAQPGDAPMSVRSWVTAHCQLGGSGGKSICTEQLAFLITGQIRDSLRNLVFAHLESDLPLVFWWQGDFTDRFEQHLYRRIDRLVIDSSTWSDPLVQLEILRDAWKDSASHFVVLDLVWMRIFPFRQALAGAFDESSARAHLDEFNRLEITHAPGHGLTARLLAAWMAYKAGWSFERVTLSLIENEGAPLSHLRLSSPDFAINITRYPNATFLHATIGNSGSTNDHITPALDDSPAALVRERLSRGGNNPLYFKLWHAAIPLIDQTGPASV